MALVLSIYRLDDEIYMQHDVRAYDYVMGGHLSFEQGRVAMSAASLGYPNWFYLAGLSSDC